MSECIFCTIPDERIIEQNDLAYAIYDGFPVTKYHTLVIPKRHAKTYFDLTKEEIDACHNLLVKIRSRIENSDSFVNGFNIGINNGESAGQTVFHCHIHFIPRRVGDMGNPRGGVRGVIPNKQRY
ncbi:MAG: HIT family protein [Gammaproteobacteria bacterium]|nr:HIT family protein [Gammaproteobacteria bacterium]